MRMPLHTKRLSFYYLVILSCAAVGILFGTATVAAAQTEDHAAPNSLRERLELVQEDAAEHRKELEADENNRTIIENGRGVPQADIRIQLREADTLEERRAILDTVHEPSVESRADRSRGTLMRAQALENTWQHAEAMLDRMLTRLTRMIDRFENILNRVVSRLEKFEDRGIDTSEARERTETARTAINTARAAIESLRSSLDSLETSENPRNLLQEMPSAMRDIIAGMRGIHRAVVDAVRAVGDIADQLGTTPKERAGSEAEAETEVGDVNTNSENAGE